MSSIINPLLGNTANGSSFQATPATLQQPTTAQQATDQYGNANAALQQQQAFLQAVQAQNGLGNQSNVFNQLQGVASGTGPNPAQAMLNQATGANTANQAALMAGQRGSSANPGLIARQAAMQGGANQQNAAGQGATLQANQSLNALGQMGTIAGQQANQQAAATGANTAATQGEQGQILGAVQGQNQANVANQSNVNTTNANMAKTNAEGQQNLLGNLTGAAGSALGLMSGFGALGAAAPAIADIGGASGGTGMASSGPGNQMMNGFAQGGAVGPQSKVGQYFAGTMPAQPAVAMAHGGAVPALVSPGEQYIPPDQVKAVAEGKKDPLKTGERIPGKPKFKGNDYRNDTVPKTLKEGGLVIPNEVMQSKHPHWAAKKFVEAHMAKQSLPKKPKASK